MVHLSTQEKLKCAPVWTPYQKGAQDDLEKVQRRATRWICIKVGQGESLLVQNIRGMPVPAKMAHCAAKTPAALMLSNF